MLQYKYILLSFTTLIDKLYGVELFAHFANFIIDITLLKQFHKKAASQEIQSDLLNAKNFNIIIVEFQLSKLRYL